MPGGAPAPLKPGQVLFFDGGLLANSSLNFEPECENLECTPIRVHSELCAPPAGRRSGRTVELPRSCLQVNGAAVGVVVDSEHVAAAPTARPRLRLRHVPLVIESAVLLAAAAGCSGGFGRELEVLPGGLDLVLHLVGVGGKHLHSTPPHNQRCGAENAEARGHSPAACRCASPCAELSRCCCCCRLRARSRTAGPC